MKSHFYRDVTVGLTALLGLAGLIVMLILFGELTNFGKKTYPLTAMVSNASGLRPGAPVTLNGVRVGEVGSVSVRPAPAPGAVVEFNVREPQRIPRAAVASIDRSFVGESTLEFTLPPGLTPEQAADTFKPGDVFDAGSPKTPLTQIAEMVSEPLDRISSTARGIEKLAEEYTLLGQRLNEMVAPRTPADVANGQTPNLRTVIERLDRTLAGVESIAADREFIAQAKGLVARAEQTMQDAGRVAAAWEKTAAGIDASMTDVRGTIDQIAERMTGALAKAESAGEELAMLLKSVRAGEGTAGQLFTNPDLYNSLEDAARRLDSALAEFELLMQKMRKEGVRIGL